MLRAGRVRLGWGGPRTPGRPPAPAPLQPQVDKGGRAAALQPTAALCRRPHTSLLCGARLLRTCARRSAAGLGTPCDWRWRAGGSQRRRRRDGIPILLLLPIHPSLPPPLSSFSPGALCTFFSNHPRRQTLMGNLAPRWKNACYEGITGTPKHLPRHHRHPVWRHTWVRAGGAGVGSGRRGNGMLWRHRACGGSLLFHPPSGAFLGTRSREWGGEGEGDPSLSLSPAWLLHSFGGEEGAGFPLLSTLCVGLRGAGLLLEPGSLHESCALGWGFHLAPRPWQPRGWKAGFRASARLWFGDLFSFTTPSPAIKSPSKLDSCKSGSVAAAAVEGVREGRRKKWRALSGSTAAASGCRTMDGSRLHECPAGRCGDLLRSPQRNTPPAAAASVPLQHCCAAEPDPCWKLVSTPRLGIRSTLSYVSSLMGLRHSKDNKRG